MSELQHETWEDAHRGKIAGSEISAILGINKYKTPYDVWARIKGGFAEEKQDTMAMFAGRMAEPLISQLYAFKKGVTAISTPDTSEFEKDGVTVAYSPDRVCDATNTVLEFKNVGKYAAKSYGEDGDPAGFPLYHQCQAQCYAFLGGYSGAEGVAYFGGDDLRIYPLDYDSAVIKDIIDFVVEWGVRYIVGDDVPHITAYTPSVKAAVVDAIIRKSTDGVATATDLQEDAMAQIKQMDEEIKEIQSRRDLVMCQVMESIPAGAKSLSGAFGKLSIFERAGITKWKEVAELIAKRAGIDPAELETMAAEHKGKSTYQTKITFKKEEK